MLVKNLLPLIQSRIEVIPRYRLSHMTYFWSYYGNPILPPYVMIWISFCPPLIKPILYLCTTNLTFMPGSFC